MKESFKKLIKRLRNKYLITTLVFGLWLVFFDQFNMVDRYQSLHTMRQLQRDKAYYEKKIKEDTQRLKELKTNRENLEKFAREQYLMKKDNEDIFVFVDKE
jgi:cell division protein DivIC